MEATSTSTHTSTTTETSSVTALLVIGSFYFWNPFTEFLKDWRVSIFYEKR
jgi:hypothetical protein